MPFTCEDAVAFIAESVNVGYATISPEFKFISINLAYCKMLNTVPELVIGKTFVEFTHPEDAAIDVALATQLKNGEATDYAFAKRHIQRGSTPLKRLEVWGLLTVRAIWQKDEFFGYRVTFAPLEKGVSSTDWLAEAKGLFVWAQKNWKTITTVLAMILPITWVGSDRLLEMLQKAKSAKASIDSVLQPELLGPSSQPSLPSKPGEQSSSLIK